MTLPRFRLGVNYWSRAGGPRMWERFDEAVVRRELQQMRAVGLDCARVFAFVPTFMPRPPAVEAAPLAHLTRLGELAREAGIDLYPTALVGHMSGENYDFPGRNGRSLWSDPELRDWQRALATEMVRALGAAPVAGWVLSNEMPLWAGMRDGSGAACEIADWASDLTSAVRAADPLGRPVGTGDGAMSSFPTRAIAKHVDWVAPHVYYGDTDPLRQAWQTDLAIRMHQPLGRPVLLEEFGGSQTQVGEREHAAYVREAVCAALGTGAAGAFPWCFTDYDPETFGRETPYSHHGFELGFGLVRKDGSEKPVCDELRALRRFLDAHPSARARAPRVAIVRPRYLDEDFPFSWQDAGLGQRTLLQAFVLASQAGLDPALVHEDDDFQPYALLLCPATQKLTVPTWLKLKARAHAGATVYWSYFSGDHAFHQGTWCPIFEELTGLRHGLRYGCFDLPPARVTLKAPLSISVPTGIEHTQAPWPLARLPVTPLPDAPVRTLATDGDGRPALTAHDVGSGRVIFCAYPYERYLALAHDGSTRDAHRLYRLLGDEAGVAPAYPTRHSDVQSRVLEAGADDLVVVQHRGWTDAVDDATWVPREAEVVLDRSGREDGALGPKGVRIYRVPLVRTAPTQ